MATIDTSVINTPAGFGDRERIQDAAFVARRWLEHSYLPSNPCATLPHHWAELKSSILVNMFIQENMKQPLVTFERGILSRIYEALPGPTTSIDKMDYDFKLYTSLLANATPGRLYDAYPVAQSRNFANQSMIGAQDPLLLFNFIKYKIWGIYMLGWYDPAVDPDGVQYHGDFYFLSSLNWMQPANCNVSSIRQTLFMNVVMPNLFSFLSAGVRGEREDFRHGETVDRVGITYIDNPGLRRILVPGIDPTVRPWKHPGNSQCKMPYRGKWGQKIRIARAQESVWASYMCGISGSTAFFLWSYLMSITNQPNIPNPTLDIHNVFFIATSLLTGDGGHNIREVVYAIALFFCVIYNLYIVFEQELQQVMGNQYTLDNNLDLILNLNRECIQPGDYVNGRLFDGPIIRGFYDRVGTEWINLGFVGPKECTVNSNPSWLNPGTPENRFRGCLFGTFLRGLKNVGPAIMAGYRETNHLNITGITQSDLATVLNGPNPFPQYQNGVARWMLNLGNPAGTPFAVGPFNPPPFQFLDDAQIFLALDNNRYLNENWENGANDFMERIVRLSYPGGNNIMTTLNDMVLQAYRNCNEGAEPMEQIPFAFPGRKNKSSKMPQGNVGYNKHIQKGERILQEEAERDSYYRTTQHEMEGEEKFTVVQPEKTTPHSERLLWTKQARPFWGTWMLCPKGWTMTTSTQPNQVYPMGPRAFGNIMYAPDAYMSVFITTAEPLDPATVKLDDATPVLQSGTNEQCGKRFRQLVSYFGNYTFDSHNGKRVVTHHIVNTTHVPQLFHKQVREYHFSPDMRYLTLRAHLKRSDGTIEHHVLKWQRPIDA